MKLRPLAVFFVLAAALAGGCVGGSKGLSNEDKERLKPFVLTAAPDIPHKLDINYENKVHLIGYKAEPEIGKPGSDVKLTFYWRCDDLVEEGWQLFTHVEPEGADKPENLDGVGPLREFKGTKQVLGPERWERGKFYVDEQTYHIADGSPASEIKFYTGVWKGDARLRVISGPNDGQNRGLGVTLKTTVQKPDNEPPPRRDPVMSVTKLAKGETITIDGKADEKAWATAASTGAFVDVGSGRPPAKGFAVNATAKVTWDDQNVYLFFDVKETEIVGYFTDAKSQVGSWTATGQPKLWTKDTVELMIDPDGDGDNKDYYELQINPQNKLFHSQFDTKNMPNGGDNGPFGHEDWDPKLKSAVVVTGWLDKKDDKNEGYTVEIAIPWKAFEKGAKQLPPKNGDAWRVNLYAMKDNSRSTVAWSPILGQGNFHTAPRFGKIVWVDPSAPAAAADAGTKDAGPAGSASAAASGAPSAAPSSSGLPRIHRPPVMLPH
jgi:hypothetical protein